MNLPRSAALAALPCLLLTACGSPMVWYSPEGAESARQLRMDLAGCRSYGEAHKGAVGGWNGGSFLASSLIADGAKNSAIENCMISKGYEKVKQGEVPAGKPFVKE
jgi:hypothetical protein